MNLAKLLKDRRTALGLTMLDVANACDVSEATVSRWESGNIGDMKRSRIAALAEILKISPLIILGIDNGNLSPDRANLEFIKIPIYDRNMCESGNFIDDAMIDYIHLPTSIIAPGREYFAIYAHGDSMIGENIHDSDLLVFEKTKDVSEGGVGCFCSNDDTMYIRRYYPRQDSSLIYNQQTQIISQMYLIQTKTNYKFLVN